MLDGAAKVKPMLAEAQRLQMPAIGMTDHGNMFGASEFYNSATEAGIKPIIGTEPLAISADQIGNCSHHRGSRRA
jgi:DNA polymerase-3 subunit alpha